MSRRASSTPLVISWAPPTRGGGASRARDLARVLGGEVEIIHPLEGLGPLRKLARYVASMPLTTVRILLGRPSAVVAQSPPAFCGAAALVGARLRRVPLVLDAHPGAFGLMDDHLSARLLPLLRAVARRSSATLVTEPGLAGQVDAWGGRGVVFHEAPSERPPAPMPAKDDRRREVLYIGTFQPDEPLETMLGAAARLADARVVVTGDLSRAPQGLAERAPEQVELCGYLGPEEYAAAIERAEVVVVLTTEATSVSRAAYEAVWAGRPIVVSDTAAARDAFPHAFHVDNEPSAVADGIAAALRLDDPGAHAARAREDALLCWAQQRSALVRAVSGA